MANEVTVLPPEGESAYIQLRPNPGQDLKEAQENIGASGINLGDLPKIKVPSGGTLSYTILALEGEEAARELEPIIVAWKPARGYWPKPLGEGGRKIPDCVSADGFIGVGSPGGDCTRCPYAQFGSASKGHGQACKQMRQMVLLMPGELLPYILVVPPTSLKNCAQYFLSLYSKQVPYWTVVTKLRLEKASNEDGVSYGKMLFYVSRHLTATEKAVATPLHQQMKKLLDPLVVDARDYQGEEGPSGPGRGAGPEIQDSDVPF